MPVLFTTFIKSLPPVLANLYDKLPKRGVVRSINVDKLASRLCKEAGYPSEVDKNTVKEAFNQGFNEIIWPDTPLHGLTLNYMKEEIERVLKARYVASLDEYLGMERTGRNSRFTAPMREQAWELKEKYDNLLAKASKEDFADVLRRARDLVRPREPIYRVYRAAVIDEAQEISHWWLCNSCKPLLATARAILDRTRCS